MKDFLKDKRNLVISLLTVLFLIKSLQAGTRFIFWVLLGVVLSAGLDAIIKSSISHKFVIPKSGIITGIIVSGIISYNEPWFIICIFPLIAILSKNIIRYKGQPIFNPANFALFIATLFKIPLTWNIESNIYIIILCGVYIAFSIRKMPHICGFILSFSVLLSIFKINPFLLISWFFVFIMLIEPKTSGFGRLHGFIFGSIAGITSALILKIAPYYDMYVVGLFIANISRPFLGAIKVQKAKKT